MLSRRTFFVSAVVTSAATTLARAQTMLPQTLLRLERRTIEVNGKPASVFGIRQPDGTFGIGTRSGAQFRVRVENRINEPSLIHWHGLTPPWQQDGVRRQMLPAKCHNRALPRLWSLHAAFLHGEVGDTEAPRSRGMSL